MRSPGPAFDLRASLAEELRAAIEELETSEGRRKGLHRCRVRVKRARALARAGRACAPGLSAVFNDSARGVMRMLAQQRELAALSDAARTIAQDARKQEASALHSIADALELERAATPGLDIEAARNGLRDLLALAQVWPEASTRQIRHGGARIIKRARRARKRGYNADEPQLRHKWRKREKDRYYGALLLGAAWPKPRRRKLGKKLGEILGDERDTLLLIERLRREPSLASMFDNVTPRAIKALKRHYRKLARHADALGARLHKGGA